MYFSMFVTKIGLSVAQLIQEKIRFLKKRRLHFQRMAIFKAIMAIWSPVTCCAK
jgi:hypothetical protein